MSIPSSVASLDSNFILHPQLAKDCAFVCDLTLCRVLLMNNSQFPWIILVPMRPGARELFDLPAEDYTLAMQEIRFCAERFCQLTEAHKMNIAALGNMVPQLHIHIIARYPHDSAWPAPVWSSTPAGQPYSEADLLKKIKKIRDIFLLSTS